jgi:uncharacterized protein
MWEDGHSPADRNERGPARRRCERPGGDAAASLTRFAARIDTARCGSPALLGVIVATGYGYRREDGVAVIPIGALGP